MRLFVSWGGPVRHHEEIPRSQKLGTLGFILISVYSVGASYGPEGEWEGSVWPQCLTSSSRVSDSVRTRGDMDKDMSQDTFFDRL